MKPNWYYVGYITSLLFGVLFVFLDTRSFVAAVICAVAVSAASVFSVLDVQAKQQREQSRTTITTLRDGSIRTTIEVEPGHNVSYVRRADGTIPVATWEDDE